MPFKPDSLPSQIAAAHHHERELFGAQGRPVNQGAAQDAKQSAARWSEGGVRNPRVDAAPPWFAGARPFTETRLANAKSFEGWRSSFDSTDMGYAFAAPPPEPAPMPGPTSPDQKSGVA